MRKLLLASAAILGATGGAAFAQTPPNQLQGQYAAPLLGGPAANNNLNTFGTATPGAALAPAPGTVVIRLNGKLYAGFDLDYNTGSNSPPGTLSNGVAVSAAPYKLNPIGMASFLRLYPGIDGMATNGLRYGAGAEIRENFEGGNTLTISAAPTATGAVAITNPIGGATAGTNSSASGNSSAETLFVRRAFVYIGTDQLGIIRMGQQDGLISIYDATGIFTVGSWDGGIGNINNGNIQAVTPNQYLISWGWLSGNGTEYGDNKIVYLSPSFMGVDVGVEFGPNMGNSFASSATSDPYAVGPCNTASANCINVTSGTDASRWINRWGFGVRAIENIAGAVIQGYADYTLSGEAKNGAAVLMSPAHPLSTGAGAIKYDGQSFFNGGLAATYLGVTVAGDLSVGRLNGSNALDPTGGVPMHAEMASASYAVGPYSIGAIVGIEDSQGSADLVGTSQRHEVAFAVGGAYRIAPGINLCVEYQYELRHQGDFNFNTNVAGPAVAGGSAGGTAGVGNTIHGQGLEIATIVNW